MEMQTKKLLMGLTWFPLLVIGYIAIVERVGVPTIIICISRGVWCNLLNPMDLSLEQGLWIAYGIFLFMFLRVTFGFRVRSVPRYLSDMWSLIVARWKDGEKFEECYLEHGIPPNQCLFYLCAYLLWLPGIYIIRLGMVWMLSILYDIGRIDFIEPYLDIIDTLFHSFDVLLSIGTLFYFSLVIYDLVVEYKKQQHIRVFYGVGGL